MARTLDFTPRSYQNADGTSPVGDRTTVGRYSGASNFNALEQDLQLQFRRLKGTSLLAQRDYGAPADAIEAIITIAGGTLSTASWSGFNSTHIGKKIAIPGAGTSNGNHVTTITAVTAGVSATLSAPAANPVTSADSYIGTGDDAAINALINDLEVGIVDPDNSGGFRKAAALAELESGEYLITSVDTLMKVTTNPTFGYYLRGHGDTTRIIFAPTTAGPLFHNSNQFLFPVVENLTIIGVGGAAAGTDLVKSESSGVAQGFRWNNVHVGGAWNNGARLGAFSGTANGNDSWVFRDCMFTGTYGVPFAGGAATGSVFQIGIDAGIIAQDQAVAHVFDGCYFTVNGCAALIRMDYGGCVEVSGGSMVFANVAANANARCFYMPAQSAHQSNTQSLHVSMMRVECRHVTSKIIECGWLDGNITMNNVSSDYSAMPATQIAATFDGNTSCGPVVKWRECNLGGKHEYKFRQNEYLAGMRRVKYESCRIYSQLDLRDFIVHTDVSGNGAIGSRWMIEFDDDCRGAGGYSTTAVSRSYATKLGWRTTPGGMATKVFYPVGKTNFGVLPASATSASWTTVLPIGVIVVGLHYRMPPNGANTGTGWSISVKDSLGNWIDPAGVAWAPGTQWNLGWERHVDFGASGNGGWKDLDTDGKRQIVVTVSNMTSSSTSSDVLLECFPSNG